MITIDSNIATVRAIPSDAELEGMIRDFSPCYSPEEIIPIILRWIESKKPTEPDLLARNKRTRAGKARKQHQKIDKMWKGREFCEMKNILWEMIGKYWSPKASIKILNDHL